MVFTGCLRFGLRCIVAAKGPRRHSACVSPSTWISSFGSLGLVTASLMTVGNRSGFACSCRFDSMTSTVFGSATWSSQMDLNSFGLYPFRCLQDSVYWPICSRR